MRLAWILIHAWKSTGEPLVGFGAARPRRNPSDLPHADPGDSSCGPRLLEQHDRRGIKSVRIRTTHVTNLRTLRKFPMAWRLLYPEGVIDHSPGSRRRSAPCETWSRKPNPERVEHPRDPVWNPFRVRPLRDRTQGARPVVATPGCNVSPLQGAEAASTKSGFWLTTGCFPFGCGCAALGNLCTKSPSSMRLTQGRSGTQICTDFRAWAAAGAAGGRCRRVGRWHEWHRENRAVRNSLTTRRLEWFAV